MEERGSDDLLFNSKELMWPRLIIGQMILEKKKKKDHTELQINQGERDMKAKL